MLGFGNHKEPDITDPSELLARLGAIIDPKLGLSLQTLDWVKDLKVSKSRVTLSLGKPYPEYPSSDALEKEAHDLLSGLGYSKIDIDTHLAVPHFRGAAKRLVPGIRNMIAVASGKGGVGKSTVSMNLALALANLGFQVGFLDCDIYGPSLPAMIGVHPKPRMGANNQIIPHRALGLAAMSMGFLLEPGQAATWRGPMVHKMIQQFLFNVAWGELDFLVLDLPPGTGDVQLSLTQESPLNAAIVVTTPQEAALADARKGVEMFRKVDVPVVGFVENMAGYTCRKCGKAHELFQAGGGQRLANEYQLPLLARLPLDPSIATGGTDASPLLMRAPKSEAGLLFKTLAEGVCLGLHRLSSSWQPTQPHVMEV